MIMLKLAFRNLMGAGIRTWLNAVVLSLSYVMIIWSQGLYDGMNKQAGNAKISMELGGGHFWQETYDPFDSFSLQDAHSPVPPALLSWIEKGRATPILMQPATIYPDGRLLPVLLRGIDPDQTILDLPTRFLEVKDETLPVLIGQRMAKVTGLSTGDKVTLRWRDANGAFDALDAHVVQVMSTDVPSVDNGQLWVSLERLQAMMDLPGETTIIVIAPNQSVPPALSGWIYRDLDFLLADIKQLVRSKKVGATIFYVILLFLAMLAIFNTQILSIFRRHKEIGTLIALGMTRTEVIRLFTLEGGLHGVLAAAVGCIYGIPLFAYFAIKGMALPVEDFGFPTGHLLFPSYSLALVAGTTLIILVTVTAVSFLPARTISKMKPTDALRGKLI